MNERLIPAHAGKTLTPAGVFVIQGAHPRSRGENWVEGEAELGFTGSSPLTRGGQVLWSGVIVLCPSGWVMR